MTMGAHTRASTYKWIQATHATYLRCPVIDVQQRECVSSRRQERVVIQQTKRVRENGEGTEMVKAPLECDELVLLVALLLMESVN